jgi:predicted ATPase
MRYFLDRIDEDAVYFLDEPENSLSIERQIELAEYIAATARATRSQFIIATHSPVFLAMKGAKIYNIDDYPASVCKWTELPNVRRYFDFFMEHQDEFE